MLKHYASPEGASLVDINRVRRLYAFVTTPYEPYVGGHHGMVLRRLHDLYGSVQVTQSSLVFYSWLLNLTLSLILILWLSLLIVQSTGYILLWSLWRPRQSLGRVRYSLHRYDECQGSVLSRWLPLSSKSSVVMRSTAAFAGLIIFCLRALYGAARGERGRIRELLCAHTC